LDEQRQDLENERRSLAVQRQREPIIAESIKGVVLIVVAALPLVVCWYLVKSLFVSVSDDSTAAEILIEQLATQGPLLTACSSTGLPFEADDRDSSMRLSPANRLRLPERREATAVSNGLRVVIVVEGAHDVEFLKRISRVLAQTDSSLPELGRLESAGTMAFMSRNGESTPFPTSFTSMGPAEFHLLDREVGPTAVQREALVRTINARPNCRAVLTAKRAIENYLHPEAIRDVGGLSLTFGDQDDVPEMVAHAVFEQSDNGAWQMLSRRARRRLRDKAKKWLNRDAVDRMTPARLDERDPDGEVSDWLRTIGELSTASTATLA